MTDEAEDVGPVPMMAIVGVEAWGVAPDGSAVQVRVQTASQRVMLALSFEQAIGLQLVLKAAAYQARQNAAALNGEGLVQAVPVNRFMVGHTPDTKGVLMVIDGEMPTETVYVVDPDKAVELGKLLTGEGQRQRVLAAGGKLPDRPTRKLILPGLRH